MSEASVGYATAQRSASGRIALSRPVGILLALFFLSLALMNPYVHGDGVGYYAYAQSLVIDHNLQFEDDWRAANPGFLAARTDAAGKLLPQEYTATGHLQNHFSVGPALLWAPFLQLAHAGVLIADAFGAQIPANGYSRPYLVAMAFSTVLYGFLGLLMSFHLALQFASPIWALLATLGIWFATSLPVYMYFNPAWSHAHSAFAVALFLWYWQRTRPNRTTRQWIVLGLAAGLMMNVYYPNAMVMIVPGVEALGQYSKALAGQSLVPPAPALLRRHLIFLCVSAAALAPTFLTKYIVYGSAFESGYPPAGQWRWLSPVLFSVLFSANHGLLSWTPILIPALLGLFAAWRSDAVFAGGLLACAAAYIYFIASYPDWDGMSSFGNRFFISLTALFVVGLASLLEAFARRMKQQRVALAISGGSLALLIGWNAGFIFQWGTQMLPARGPISWSEMVRNQFTAVPQRLNGELRNYLLGRQGLMQRIEVRDLQRRKQQGLAAPQ